MQISSANSGFYSASGLSARSGLYPTELPTAQKPDAGESSNANVAASNARSLQQITPPVTLTNSDVSRALTLARQSEEFGVLASIVQISQSGNDIAVQHAVAEYNTVAAQEQRFELGDVLVGIDVFV